MRVKCGTNPLLNDYRERTYCLSRSYNPALGRFISKDDLVLRPGDTLNANLYDYVSNNPVNARDPSGHFDVPEILAAIGVQAGLGALTLGTAAGVYSHFAGGSFLDGFVSGGLAGSALVVAYYQQTLPEALGAGLAAVGITTALDIVTDTVAGRPLSFARISNDALQSGLWAIATNVYGDKLARFVGGPQDNTIDWADAGVGALGAIVSGIKDSIAVTARGAWSDEALADVVSKAVAKGLITFGLRIAFKGNISLPGGTGLAAQNLGEEATEFFAAAFKSVAGTVIGTGWARLAQQAIKDGVLSALK
jgi:RHS repeat-associated protein